MIARHVSTTSEKQKALIRAALFMPTYVIERDARRRVNALYQRGLVRILHLNEHAGTCFIASEKGWRYVRT